MKEIVLDVNEYENIDFSKLRLKQEEKSEDYIIRYLFYEYNDELYKLYINSPKLKAPYGVLENTKLAYELVCGSTSFLKLIKDIEKYLEVEYIHKSCSSSILTDSKKNHYRLIFNTHIRTKMNINNGAMIYTTVYPSHCWYKNNSDTFGIHWLSVNVR